MAIKCKMFEVAESKNMKGVHIINIIKEVFKRDSHCTEHLKAKTCREENSRQQRLQQTLILPKLLASQQDSSTSHYEKPRFLRICEETQQRTYITTLYTSVSNYICVFSAP